MSGCSASSAFCAEGSACIKMTVELVIQLNVKCMCSNLRSNVNTANISRTA